MMNGQKYCASNLCVNCLQAYRSPMLSPHNKVAPLRHLSITIPHSQDRAADMKQEGSQSAAKEEGAMSRRLAEMTEQSIAEGDKSTRKNMRDAGFSEELKKQLEEKIAVKSFRSDNAAAFSLADMPVSAAAVLRLLALSCIYITDIC